MNQQAPSDAPMSAPSMPSMGASMFTRLSAVAPTTSMEIDDDFGIRKKMINTSKVSSGKRSAMNPESRDDAEDAAMDGDGQAAEK